MPIRVLHVIDHLGYGGAPFVVKSLAERMPADRVESLVCALRPNPKSLPIQAEVITLKGSKYSPAVIRSIAHICRRRHIDILHCHLQKAVISGLLATYLCESRLVIHEHGPIFGGGFGYVYRRFLWLLGSRADAIVANSQAAQAILQRTLRTADVPTTVVANFIHLERFDPDRYDRNNVRETLGLGADMFVVGFVGRLHQAKGADLLVEAAALLRDQEDSYRFFVVGDGPERKRLGNQIRRLGLQRMVVLAGLHENVAAVMRAFDVGVVPSRREAFGIAALELMRMRVPVIVSPVGGLPELVQHERTGIVLAQPAPAEIAGALRKLRGDGPLRETLAHNAFEYASLFDGRESLRRILEIYEMLCHDPGGRTSTTGQPV